MPAGETEPPWVFSSENTKPHPAGLLTLGPELSSERALAAERLCLSVWLCLSVRSIVSSPPKHFLVTQPPVTIFSLIANEIIALQELTLQPFSIQIHKIENNSTQTIALVLKAH